MSDTPISTIDELLSRDPLQLSEEDILETTRLLIQMNRKEIAIWNQEASLAQSESRPIRGASTRKRQLDATRQIALSQLPDITL